MSAKIQNIFLGFSDSGEPCFDTFSNLSGIIYATGIDKIA